MRNKFYKIIAVLLLFIMMIPQSTFAMSNKTDTDMAAALNTLSILRGDGSDYNLTGQLKRSEAAAFLVRLLGVENKVIEDKKRYLNTNFSDVDSTKWYAHYIGYVSTAGLVNGYNDGTFKPENYVSEKEFIKMILGALNYRQGIDYEWNNIYQFAHSIGLLDDSYKSKYQDNTNYTRKDTINLMYESLDKNMKSLEKTIIDRLLEREFITEQQAIEAGVLVDTVKTTIKTAIAISDKTIRLTLSEEIKDFEKENINIVEEGNSKLIDIEKVLFDEEILTITTEDKLSGNSYEITLMDVEDSFGFNTKNIDANFKGYVEKVITSNYFKISKVKAISKNVINVYFTHPINQGAEIPLYYTIKQEGDIFEEGNFKNMAVAVLGEVDNGVSLFLKDKDLAEGSTYTIVIDGNLLSDYSVELNDGDGDKMDFVGTRSSNESFELENVKPLNEDHIVVTFNKDMDVSSATDNFNYTLKDKTANFIMGSALDAVLVGHGEEKYRKVKLKYVNLNKEHEYELIIDDVKDSFKQMSIDEAEYPFYGHHDQESSVEIDYAYAENRNTVVVYFNQNIVTNRNLVDASFIMDGVSFVDEQYDIHNPNKVTLYTSSSTPMTGGDDYTLKVLSARDEFGDLCSGTIEYTIEGNPTEFGKIGISECKFIAEDTVYVEFNKNISNTLNIDSQFTLEYTKDDDEKELDAEHVGFIRDNAVIIIFESTSKSEKYKLKIVNLRDYSHQFTTSEVTRTVER